MPLDTHSVLFLWDSFSAIHTWLRDYSEGTDFPGEPVVGNPPANAGDMNLNPGPRRFHTKGLAGAPLPWSGLQMSGLPAANRQSASFSDSWDRKDSDTTEQLN